MLNEEENKYFEKWTYMQRNQQFQKRIILSLLGLVGILGLVVLFAGNSTPLVVEREKSLSDNLSYTKLGASSQAIQFRCPHL